MTDERQITGFPKSDTDQDTRGWGRAIAALLLALSLPAAALAQDGEFTASFRFQDCSFQSTGENPYFIELEPGHQLEFEAEEDGVTTTLFITVLPATRRSRSGSAGACARSPRGWWRSASSRTTT